MGATVRDVIYIFTMFPSSQWSSSQKQQNEKCAAACGAAHFFEIRGRAFAMPYVSRDGLLVFVPADAPSVPDRVAVARASSGTKRSIAMLTELGKGPPVHEVMRTGGRGGSSLLDRDLAAPIHREVSGHAAISRSARGGEVVVAPKVGNLAHVHGADDEDGGEVGAGGSPAAPSLESQGGGAPADAGAPSESARVSFNDNGGMHFRVNAQAEQVSMAVWLSRGYEERL